MSPEKMRVVIARSCNWKHDHFGYAQFPDLDPALWFDVTDDLNACAQFEQSLTDEEYDRFSGFIYDLMADGEPVDKWGIDLRIVRKISAKPLVRCTAFLMAKGLYEVSAGETV